MERKLKGSNISNVQFRALNQLMARGPMSQNQLNEILVITSATGTRLFDRMERDGWVVRQPDPTDGRVKLLVPTEKAKNIWDEIEHLGRELIEGSVAGIDPEDLELVKRTLGRIRANLESIR